MINNSLITVLGPTAVGKTRLAVLIAHRIGGEIISADSRQVYRGMDIGTGKDLHEYVVDDIKIPYHLINIAEPGEEYDLYRFTQDFQTAFSDITRRNKQPVMCGGTGLYLESIILRYQLHKAEHDNELREELENMTDEQLVNMLKSMKKLHNVTDTVDRSRLIRAIEIALKSTEVIKMGNDEPFGKIKHRIFGIHLPRQVIRDRITQRLSQRLKNGMVDEVRELIKSGVSPEKLKYYGLEYKFVTKYLLGELSYDQMFKQLNTAIHQFAKRQMTWFRRMEKKNILIHWIDGDQDVDIKLDQMLSLIDP